MYRHMCTSRVCSRVQSIGWMFGINLNRRNALKALATCVILHSYPTKDTPFIKPLRYFWYAVPIITVHSTHAHATCPYTALTCSVLHTYLWYCSVCNQFNKGANDNQEFKSIPRTPKEYLNVQLRFWKGQWKTK